MSTNTESNKYTILFAVGMVIVVGSLLAFTASSLKPNIKENERMEKQQNILYAMGINENGDNDIVFVSTDKAASEFSKYISKQLIVDALGGHGRFIGASHGEVKDVQELNEGRLVHDVDHGHLDD